MADSGQPIEGGEGHAAAAGRVRRRQVFYLAGFDPASPRKYHALFTAEASRQASVSGASIQVGPLEERGDLAAGWKIEAHYGADVVHTDYEFLRWYDIVRQAWPPDGLGLFVGIWTSLFAYERSGIMAAARRDAPVVALASSIPALWSAVFVLIYAGVVATLSFAGAALARAIGWPIWAGALPPLALLAGFIFVWRWADRFVNLAWLARGMICVVRAARGQYPELQTRCEAFARRLIAAEAAGGVDEILVVGHSMGAQLAGQSIAKALAADARFGRRGVRINLLSLGQLIPFYSLLTADPRHKAEMAALAAARQIGWLDFTSPADAGCAAALHPLLGAVEPTPADRPIRRSPRFHALMAAQTYRSLRQRPLDYHFAYLRAMDVAGDYDFFRLTTGPDPMAAPTPGPAAA